MMPFYNSLKVIFGQRYARKLIYKLQMLREKVQNVA
jgi:hypothetical protein